MDANGAKAAAIVNLNSCYHHHCVLIIFINEVSHNKIWSSGVKSGPRADHPKIKNLVLTHLGNEEIIFAFLFLH